MKRKTAKRMGLVLFIALLMALTRGAAQGAITLDGTAGAGEWEGGSQVATDPLDVFLTDTGNQPHDPPTYARSGYDAIGLWANYQTSDDRWYFRIDVDGRAGDSDSQNGTAGNLGVGTHGPDGGPLVVQPFVDATGIGPSEIYRLYLQYESGGALTTADFGGNSTILPGTVFATSGLVGSAAYGTSSNPGTIEWGFDRLQIFPAGTEYNRLWVSAEMNDGNDRVTTDQVPPVLVIGLGVQAQCGTNPVVVGDSAIFGVQYSVPSGAALGIGNVMITVAVPTGTSFVSADSGGTCAGGVITWSLGNLNPGDTGEVHVTLTIDDSISSLEIAAGMTCDEGLNSTDSCTSSVTEPPTIPALDETGMALLVLLLAAVAVLTIRRRYA